MFNFQTLSNRSSENLNFALSRLCSGMIVCLAILTFSRIILVSSFVLEQFFNITSVEKLNFFILSFRFDIKVIAIAYSLPLLLICATFHNFTFKYYKTFFRYYNNLIVLVFTLFEITNYFYFKTYDKSIDTFIFAISKEDPLAVIKTVIEEYPVGFGLVGILALVYLYKKIITKFYQYIDSQFNITNSIVKVSALLFGLVVVFAIVMRGSFGTFPLRQLNAQVCDKPGINYSIPNGTLAFYWAYKWEQESVQVPQATNSEIIAAYKDLGFDSVSTDSIESLVEPLKKRTAKNEFLETQKPDIVFNVMESMSTHMLTLDDPNTRDLLGSLRKHFKSDFVFKNFVSEGDGTSDSLTRILVSAPDLNLSTSLYSNKDYICNIAKIMKKAGYETIFVTASTASWRNYDNFLRTLGFDRVVERTLVESDFPHATAGAWGIDDEYLFKETYKILRDKHDKPRFILTLSISNHPPFRLPKDEAVQKVSLPADVLERFPYSNTETIFATFRYANNQLGNFIDLIKSDEMLKDSTFIAATGDHNMRGIGYNDYPDELVFGHEVPLYIYMPQKYIENTNVKYDKDKRGSQKDIFTTLVSHAISDFEFHSFGCDMLSDTPCAFPYAYNSTVAVAHDKDYACSIPNSKKKALGYKFTGAPYMIVNSNPDPKLDCTKERALKRLDEQLYYLQANAPQNK